MMSINKSQYICVIWSHWDCHFYIAAIGKEYIVDPFMQWVPSLSLKSLYTMSLVVGFLGFIRQRILGAYLIV